MGDLIERLEQHAAAYSLLGEKELPALLREAAAALRAAPVPRVNIECETSDGYIIGTTSLPVIRVELEDDGSYTAVTDYWPPASDVHDATRAARPQEANND